MCRKPNSTAGVHYYHHNRCITTAFFAQSQLRPSQPRSTKKAAPLVYFLNARRATDYFTSTASKTLITKITGRLVEVTEETLTIESLPFCYEVLVADFTRRRMQSQLDQTVTLHTIQYIEGNAAQGGKLTPRLVGFESVVERSSSIYFARWMASA